MSFLTHTSKLSVLRTNLMPEEQDAIQIKHSISYQETIIADLDSKILQLQTQRDVAAKSLAIDRALIAPVRKLAPELLATIFEYCLPAKSPRRDDMPHILKHRNRPRTFFSRYTNDEAPFLLLRVCHRWHDIAQQTPRLWTNVPICCKRSIAYASASLRNSRSLPLNVCISNVQQRGGCCATCQWGEEYPVLISPNSLPPHPQTRIESIDSGNPPFAKALRDDPKFHELLVNKLAITSSLDFEGPLDVLSTLVPPTQLDLLQELVIDCTSTTPDVHVFSLLKAPSLRVLQLHEAADMIMFIEPSNSLRHLTISAGATEIPSGPLYEFLRSCPGLEELVFRCDNRRRFEPPTEPQNLIQLPALRKLEIDSDTGAHLIGLLYAPNIQQALFCYEPSDWPPVQTFFSIAHKSLVSLAFRTFPLISPLLHELMDALPYVELLAFEDCDMGGRLWEYLTPGEATLPESWKCPKLKHLKMSHTLVNEEFVEFVRRRADNYPRDGTQGEGGGYLFDVKLQECMISSPVVKALWDVVDQRDNVVITGLPAAADAPAQSDNGWQPWTTAHNAAAYDHSWNALAAPLSWPEGPPPEIW